MISSPEVEMSVSLTKPLTKKNRLRAGSPTWKIRAFRLRAILKDDGEAEDVMQQAYVNAYVHLEQFAERASFSTWLTKIAVYEALARSRHRGAAGVDSLPEHHRVVFTLRQIEGLSTAKTAECLGISEENVKTRLHRARALLRADLLARAGAATSGAFQFHLSRCDRVVAGVLEKINAARAGHGLENVN